MAASESRGRRALCMAVLLMAAAQLAACATPRALCARGSVPRAIAINSEPGTNHGRPIAVDLVFATDPSVSRALSALTARDYFGQREQLRVRFPKGLMMVSWELQAGQYVPNTGLEPPCGVLGTLIFADYASAGDHRISLHGARAGTLVLGADDMSWFRMD